MKIVHFPRFDGGFFSHSGRLILIVLMLSVMGGCDEPDEIGLDLLSNRASFSSTDTLTIHAYSDKSENVATNFSAQSILGVMEDPVFGKVKAEIFTEFRLPDNMFTLGTNPVLDSIVLYMEYAGSYYGQLTTLQTLKVYELSESFPDQDTLYSNLLIPHYPDPIGQKLLRPAPLDSVAIDTVLTSPHFSLRLSDSFGQKIIDANGTEAFENIPNFLEYFKGLYFSIEDEINGYGSIFDIKMFSFYTRLSLFYHEDEETERRQDFYINEFAKRSGYFKDFEFDGANPFLLQQLNAQDPTSYGDSLLFVQSMGKVHAKIAFPFLESLKETSNLVINKASLIIPVALEYSGEMFPPSDYLWLYRYNSSGNLELISDINYGEEYYGGSYNESTGEYTFNITHHLQQLLDGRLTDYGLALLPGKNASSAGRVVLKGPGVQNNPMRLDIVYTTFDE